MCAFNELLSLNHVFNNIKSLIEFFGGLHFTVKCSGIKNIYTLLFGGLHFTVKCSGIKNINTLQNSKDEQDKLSVLTLLFDFCFLLLSMFNCVLVLFVHNSSDSWNKECARQTQVPLSIHPRRQMVGVT